MAIFVHEVKELSDKVSCAGFKGQRPVGIFDLAGLPHFAFFVIVCI
jgi:hypothetical protein